jgi:hypothetical protein
MGDETWWTESGAIYGDCVDLANLIGIFFRFYQRKPNKTAHELARECFLMRSSCKWDDEPLVFC